MEHLSRGQTIVIPEAMTAHLDDVLGRTGALLAKDVHNNDGVGVDATNDAPIEGLVLRSSWQREPIVGMGRECGMPRASPL
jgi:hypothetical protein